MPGNVRYEHCTAGRNHFRSYGSLPVGTKPAYNRAKVIGPYLCTSSTAVFLTPALPPVTPPSRPLSRPPPCQVSTADSSPKTNVDTRDQEPFHPPHEGLEFARLVGCFGEEECSLDALLESEPEHSVSEQELIEQEEAWRLLCSWWVLAKAALVFSASHPLFFIIFSSGRGYALDRTCQEATLYACVGRLSIIVFIY